MGETGGVRLTWGACAFHLGAIMMKRMRVHSSKVVWAELPEVAGLLAAATAALRAFANCLIFILGV